MNKTIPPQVSPRRTVHRSLSALLAATLACVTSAHAATWYLSTSQSAGADWTTPSHWKSNTDGTGTAAPSVNANDTYINQVSSRVLRTPAGTATFGGKALDLANGASLVLGQDMGLVSTVPLLNTTGTVTITNGSAGTRGLTVTKWVANAGTTTVSTVSGAVTNLRVDDFAGAGNLVISGAGELRPFVGHTKALTGTITVNSGAKLAVQAGSPFSTGGKLVVNSGGLVVLNDWIYCTALTVNGSVKNVGTYSTKDLSGFTTSNDSKVVVYTPDLAGPEQMFGVNIAGTEFTPTRFWQKDPTVWDYYQSKGLTQIRFPIKWHYIQPVFGGNVDLSEVDECIRLAKERNMKIIIDLHNYGAYAGGDHPPRIGSSQVPVSTWIDLWKTIAAKYRDEPTVIGYDLMNEPIVYETGSTSGNVASWGVMVQQAVHAIRRIDQRAYIYVEGLYASNARNWIIGTMNNATLDIKDPVGRLVYSAHCYWDSDGSGTKYTSTYTPTSAVGKNHVMPFVTWLKQTRPYAYGHIGEYGIPRTFKVQEWGAAIEVFLAYLRENNISGTYWAGGENWPLDDLKAIHPNPFPGPDMPQMASVEKFHNTLPASNVFVDNQMSGTLVTFLPSVAAWTKGNSTDVTPRFYGDNYQSNGTAGASVKFTPRIHASGNYDVFVRWSIHDNRSHSVPVTVVHANGTDTSVTLNQEANQPNAVDGWNPIGNFTFNAGTGGSVTLHATGNGLVMADAVWFRPSNAFPQGWQSGDVGALSIAGTSGHSGGDYTLTSAGTIYGTGPDAFHFVYKNVAGDFTLTARVESQTNTNTYARAGVMVRDGLGATAPFANAIVTPAGAGHMQHRTTAGDPVTTTPGGAAGAPYWVQIKRVGNEFRAYKSDTGASGSWLQMGMRVIPMGSTVQVGLFACSFTTNTQSTVIFDNVTVVP